MKTEILEHDIKWWVDDDEIKELDECSIEHIENLIKEGCTQGELNVGEQESRGWWEIVNWMDIACELRNALISHPGVAFKDSAPDKALKRYDENW